MSPYDLTRLIAGQRGHFRMESGFHSEWWFELGRLFEHPERVRPHVAALAHRLRAHRIDAVCGPMTGGAKLAELIGAELRIDCFHTKRIAPPSATGLFPVVYRLPVEQRGAVRGKSIAIVDDAISAGSAVRGTYTDLIAHGARPVAIGALILFSNAIAGFAQENGLALEGVARMPFEMWPPGECPLCRAGVPVEKRSDGE